MPRFLEPNGLNAWKDIRARVGWIGFREIHNHLGPGPAYQTAVATMLRELTPPGREQQQAEGEPLHTVNFRKFGVATLGLVAKLEDLARDHFGQECIDHGDGSSSVRIA